MLPLAQIVMERCDRLASFTEEPGRITRRFLSPPMRDVHRELTGWMQKAGMTVRIDAAGNIIGRRLANRTTPSQTLLLGSHLDTVPNAGKYDGIIGVMVSLAAVEALTDDSLPFAIDVIGFSEEEGVRFSQPYLGSRAVCGSFDPAWLNRRDLAGITLQQAIVDFGLDVQRLPEAAYDPAGVIGYVEAHIEQGLVLEEKGLPLAVVDAIVGQSRLVLRITGKAGHAGTTPMERRQDALVGAAIWIQEVNRLARETQGLRATVGRIAVTPNASNVIPAQVELSLDLRHPVDAVRLDAIDRLLALGEESANRQGLVWEVVHRNDASTLPASSDLIELLAECLHEHRLECTLMSSGAGHDAAVLAERFPMAMLFIRHPKGISHHPDESVDVADVAIAIEVLVSMVRRLALRKNSI